MTPKDTKTSYLTIRQISEKYPFLTLSGWTWKIRSDKEFQKKCVRRFGRKVLLNEAKVLEFIDKSQTYKN